MRRFEYEISIHTTIHAGDTVWFVQRGAHGVGEVKRSPCLESGYNGLRGGAYEIELIGGLRLWSNEVTKAVRPYQTGAWLFA